MRPCLACAAPPDIKAGGRIPQGSSPCNYSSLVIATLCGHAPKGAAACDSALFVFLVQYVNELAGTADDTRTQRLALGGE